MPQLFPCLKLIEDSEDPNTLISEFQIKGSKQKSHLQLFKEWLVQKNAHVLAVDIRDTLVIDQLLRRFTASDYQQEVFKVLRVHLDQHTIKMHAFLEKSQFIQQNYCEPISYPYGITIDDQIITDASITSTFKGFFCHRCCLYDCRNHENKKEHNFAHPLTQVSDAKHQQEIIWLQTFHREYLEQNIAYPNQPNQSEDEQSTLRQKCSQQCYLKLSLAELEKLRKEKTYNEFEHAFIKAGIKRVSYNPCLINLIDRRFTCAEMFVYLIQYEGLLSVSQEKRNLDKRHRSHHSKQSHSNRSYFNKHLYYEPCCHYFYDEEPKDLSCSDCGCSKRGFCDIYCGCDPSKCKRRRVGCKCLKGMCKTKKCACFSLGMECDPEHCRECFGCRKGRCYNNEYLYHKQEGLGLYNVFPIKANQLVLSYLGEYISEDEQVIRESWLKSMIFYTFTKNDFEKLVDSKYFGNKSRFLNHHIVMENCYARSVYSRGDYHLGLYAKQDIPPGHELLFDYDADQTLAKENTWITEPSFINYKIRRDNIRICIPRNKVILGNTKDVIIIEDNDEEVQQPHPIDQIVGDDDAADDDSEDEDGKDEYDGDGNDDDEESNSGDENEGEEEEDNNADGINNEMDEEADEEEAKSLSLDMNGAVFKK